MFHETFIRIVALILSAALIVVPVNVFGQENNTSSNNIKFTYVMTGKVVPFTGYLFSPDAIIKVMSDNEFKLKNVELEKQFALKKLEADLQFKFDSLQLSYDTLKKQEEQITKIKDEEIASLRKIVEKSNKPDYAAYWYLGGVGTGVVLSVVLYFVIAEVRK